MTGGILQLVLTGIDTVYLTGDPSITMFKCVYRRHTNFTISQSNCVVQKFSKFGNVGKYYIEKKGDCISNMLMRIDIGNFNVTYLKPTNKNIKNVLLEFDIIWSNTIPDANIITQNTYKNILKPIIYDAIESRVNIYNTYYKIYNDIQNGINYYNTLNGYTKILITKKINKIFNDTSFYTNKNEIYLKLNNLITNITPNNYTEKFVYVDDNIIERNIDGTYTGSITENLDLMNEKFTDISNDIINIDEYIKYIYEYGYGLFVLDQSGNYLIDGSGYRVEKKYKLDASNNYIYDGSGSKILRTPYLSDTTIILSGMFEVLKCYKLDVDISENFVTPLYIRDRMYDEYLNLIIQPNVDASANQINLKHIYTFYALINEIKIPTSIGYLDKNIGDYYTDTFNKLYNTTNYQYLNIHGNPTRLDYYKNFDSYKLLYKYLASLSDDNIYDDTTINNIKSYLINNVYDNLYDNYNLYSIIVKIMRDAYFKNSAHFRFGIYNTFTTYISNTYQADSRLFTVIQPSSLGLIDNFIDNINTILTPNIYFKDEIISYFNNFIINLGKTIESITFNDYLNDYSLWSFLSFVNTKFKALLRTIRYNNEVVFTLMEVSLNQNVLEKMGILNYLPLYLIDDIPNAVNNNIANMGLTTPQLNQIDLTDNTYDPVGYTKDILDISFNKTKLYKRILENVVFSDGSGLNIADSDFINAYASAYLVDTNKFSLFKLVRPEKNYPFVIDNKIYFVPNGRGIIEEYRREYYRIIKNGSNFTSLSSALKVKLFEKINLVLDQYMRFDFDNVFDSSNINNSSYISYVTQKYKYSQNLYYQDLSSNPVNVQTINNNDITKFIYAPASIYSSLIKDNTRFYNEFYNDICLSKSYYETSLGLSMDNLYDKFDEKIQAVDASGQFIPYHYFSDVSGKSIKKYNADTNDYYPRIQIIYDLSGLDNTQKQQLNYYYYNQTGLNDTIPVRNGYDFFDFQNVIYDSSMNKLVDGSGNLTETSTLLQNELILYDASYNYLRYLLDIQNKFSLDMSFNTVSTTVDYYNSFFTVTDAYVTTDIIEPTKQLLVNNYYLCGDMLYNSYDTGLSSIDLWSLKDIFNNFKKTSNPFNITNQPNLYKSYTYFTLSERNNLYSKYLSLTANLTNILYKDPNFLNLYNSFERKINLYEYFINYLIFNSDGNFLLKYNYTTIDLYNTYVQNYLLNNKTNYYNIISKIIYYNGTLPTNTEITYKNQRTAPYFPIRNIIPNSLVYEESQLDVVINGMISGIAPSYSWVKQLGYYLFEYFNLEINNEVFESHNPNLFSLMQKLFLTENHKRGRDYLIGNRIELYTYNNKDKSNISIYLPVEFWFTKNTHFNSLPLTNILYSDINITFKLKNILELLILAPYSYVEKEPKVKCSFIVDYVYLEQEERLRIAASKLEFLVEKYNYGGIHSYKYNKIINKTINTKLYFSDPTKFILWRVKIKNTDILNWNKNGYEILNYNVANYRNETTNTDFVTYFPFVKKIPLIVKTRFNFNGNLRQEGDYNYFNSVVPYECGLGALDDGEGLYSFSLFPRLYQPSGTANLSVIEDLSVDHVLTDEIISMMETYNLELEIEYWSMTYQVMRVMSGFIAPAFITQK